MELKTIKFKVRTPLFLGGISIDAGCERTSRGVFPVSLTKAELNVNAFKGVLRWWFRAIQGDSDIYEKEKQLFGSTENAASFKLKITSSSIKKDIWRRTRGKRYGYYNVNDRPVNFDGLSYFAHNLKGRSGDTILKKEFIKPDESVFEIKIIANNKNVLNKILALFWLAFQFGGIGARSRRAFGNLEILSDNEKLEINGKKFIFKNSYKDEKDYQDTLKKNFEILKSFFPLNEQNIHGTYPCFRNARLFLSKPVNGDQTGVDTSSSSAMALALQKSGLTSNNSGEKNWKEAIGFAGVTMQFFRALKEKDHSNFHNFNELKEVERAVFGLPLEFRFSNRHRLPINVNHYDGDEVTRLSSPVWVSLTEINNCYHIQYLILNYDYSSLSVKAKIKDNNIKKIGINTDIIGHFCTYLQDNKRNWIKGNPAFKEENFKYNEISLEGYSK